ncbi:unnamed protein product [Pleuronectes platessa]|uniref:Uncharacterized protein n=1 Tax=Pleuronectes platessa TaxID=8262 RepID=A0A9N7U0Z4_PLEPL|nr:unnamed protein product [Pleuronectes platessa]
MYGPSAGGITITGQEDKGGSERVRLLFVLRHQSRGKPVCKVICMLTAEQQAYPPRGRWTCAGSRMTPWSDLICEKPDSLTVVVFVSLALIDPEKAEQSQGEKEEEEEEEEEEGLRGRGK